MKKQTAVEWQSLLFKGLIMRLYFDSSISFDDFIAQMEDIETKAKEMEREHIKSAYLKGDLNGCGCYDYATEEWAEEYYEQTYGGEKPLRQPPVSGRSEQLCPRCNSPLIYKRQYTEGYSCNNCFHDWA